MILCCIHPISSSFSLHGTFCIQKEGNGRRNLRGCAKAKTLSVFAAYSSTSSWCVIPGSKGWSACIPYMSISFEIGGILGRARPVIFGACFKPSLFRICSLIASKLSARISSCILQALQALPAIAKCRTWALSMPGASKASRRTSESNSSALVTILFKVALGRIKLYGSAFVAKGTIRWSMASSFPPSPCLSSRQDLKISLNFL